MGASRSTMFCLGGVPALKRHPFFEDLDWSDLINLRLEPPIDLSQPYVPSTSGLSGNGTNNNGTSPNNSKKNVLEVKQNIPEIINSNAQHTPLKSNDSSGDVRILELTTEHLTRHFHEGFTTQQISLSVVEEALSISTRSRAGIRTVFVYSFILYYIAQFDIVLHYSDLLCAVILLCTVLNCTKLLLFVPLCTIALLHIYLFQSFFGFIERFPSFLRLIHQSYLPIPLLLHPPPLPSLNSICPFLLSPLLSLLPSYFTLFFIF